MRTIKYHCLTLIFLILAAGCEKIVDYYIGIPQQPKLTEEADTDQLNIFGVLRPDSAGAFNKSFVFVQRIWPALEFSTFSILPDAEVTVDAHEEDGSVTSYAFPLQSPDAGFYDTLYRPGPGFVPVPGQRYSIHCLHPELPDAYGELVFPPCPEIIENSLHREGTNIRFSLKADSLIEMYDFYLRTHAGSFLIGRELGSDTEDIEVDLITNMDTEGAVLRIFGYENRLATYIGNSNISLNFNKYREGFSSLDSGYGVFGALNFLDVELK